MYYLVRNFDGLGQKTWETVWTQRELREWVEKRGGDWTPERGALYYDEYNAGTNRNPSWRHSTLTWVPEFIED